jgi:hypothetical protein
VSPIQAHLIIYIATSIDRIVGTMMMHHVILYGTVSIS